MSRILVLCTYSFVPVHALTSGRFDTPLCTLLGTLVYPEVYKYITVITTNINNLFTYLWDFLACVSLRSPSATRPRFNNNTHTLSLSPPSYLSPLCAFTFPSGSRILGSEGQPRTHTGKLGLTIHATEYRKRTLISTDRIQSRTSPNEKVSIRFGRVSIQ